MKMWWCAFALLLPLGCKQEPKAPEPVKEVAAKKVEAAVAKPAEMPEVLAVDFAAEADKEITETNFEDELNALEKEIDSDE